MSDAAREESVQEDGVRDGDEGRTQVKQNEDG